MYFFIAWPLFVIHKMYTRHGQGGIINNANTSKILKIKKTLEQSNRFKIQKTSTKKNLCLPDFFLAHLLKQVLASVYIFKVFFQKYIEDFIKICLKYRFVLNLNLLLQTKFT